MTMSVAELRSATGELEQDTTRITTLIQDRINFLKRIITCIKPLVINFGVRVKHEQGNFHTESQWELKDFAGFDFIYESGTNGAQGGGYAATVQCDLGSGMVTVLQVQGQGIQFSEKDDRVVVFAPEEDNKIWTGPLDQALADTEAVWKAKQRQVEEAARVVEAHAQAQSANQSIRELATRLKVNV